MHHQSLCINLLKLNLLDFTNAFVMASFSSRHFFVDIRKKAFVPNLNSLFKWHHFLPIINHNVIMMTSSTQSDILKLVEANQFAKFGDFMTFVLKVIEESVFCAPLIPRT